MSVLLSGCRSASTLPLCPLRASHLARSALARRNVTERTAYEMGCGPDGRRPCQGPPWRWTPINSIPQKGGRDGQKSRDHGTTRRALQQVVDRIGLDRDASTARNALMPVRAIYRRALQRDIVQVNPTEGLALPAVEGRRDRVASPEEAAELLAALPEEDPTVWATALYAGLRLGELQALSPRDTAAWFRPQAGMGCSPRRPAYHSLRYLTRTP